MAGTAPRHAVCASNEGILNPHSANALTGVEVFRPDTTAVGLGCADHDQGIPEGDLVEDAAIHRRIDQA